MAGGWRDVCSDREWAKLRVILRDPGGGARIVDQRLRAMGLAKMGQRLSAVAALRSEAGVTAPDAAVLAAAAGDRLSHDAPRVFVVVHAPCVNVRERPSLAAPSLGIKQHGAEVCVSSETSDGWLRLSGEEGWLLRDGRALGLGVLLEPRLSPAADSGLQKMPLVVQCTDGLCNRLRVTLSFVRASQKSGRPLFVVWPVNNVCNGRFTDAFESLPGVSFLDRPPPSTRPLFPPHSHDFHPEIKALGEETECFAALVPTAAVSARVEANMRALAPRFISLHIRRTDHWGSTCTDADYERFVDAHPSHAVYLATDNAFTQGRFLDHPSRGPRMKACERIQPDPSRLRQTSLADAAADIFTCAAADGPFKGTFTSSFSDTIARIRALQGRAHAKDEHVLTCAQDQMAVTVATPGGHMAHSPGSERGSYDTAL